MTDRRTAPVGILLLAAALAVPSVAHGAAKRRGGRPRWVEQELFHAAHGERRVLYAVGSHSPGSACGLSWLVQSTQIARRRADAKIDDHFDSAIDAVTPRAAWYDHETRRIYVLSGLTVADADPSLSPLPELEVDKSQTLREAMVAMRWHCRH